jgi:predicted transcriptional regulator
MHNRAMKTAVLPSLRVDPFLREKAVSLLHDGETLSSFMSDALQHHVERRSAQDEFIARGMAAAEQSREARAYVTPEAVMKRLETKLANHRAARGKRNTRT